MDEMERRLKGRMRKEIVYARGMRAMHRERYMEYVADMHRAHMRGDTKRRAEIAQDLKAFAGEMWQLMEMERSAYQRLTGMVPGRQEDAGIIPDTATPDGEEPANLTRLFLKRPIAE